MQQQKQYETKPHSKAASYTKSLNEPFWYEVYKAASSPSAKITLLPLN